MTKHLFARGLALHLYGLLVILLSSCSVRLYSAQNYWSTAILGVQKRRQRARCLYWLQFCSFAINFRPIFSGIVFCPRYGSHLNSSLVRYILMTIGDIIRCWNLSCPSKMSLCFSFCPKYLLEVHDCVLTKI